jgi:D-beta-D-heptose 7-phosphate kinase/D-beta-D-heptose 1-phosphate adenosyltransferase
MNIWTNGCYDILHVGHIALFKYAKSLGDKLIIGIDSDKRVKELKGNGRPFNNQDDRKEMLESIRFVDEVVIFDTKEEMCDLLLKKNIHTIVIGDDYKNRPVTGSGIIEDIVFFKKIGNYSTTNYLESEI